jgi:hypothetical protein
MLAEWAEDGALRPLTVTDVACATCGKEGVRLVAKGETISDEAVYCVACRP